MEKVQCASPAEHCAIALHMCSSIEINFSMQKLEQLQSACPVTMRYTRLQPTGSGQIYENKNDRAFHVCSSDLHLKASQNSWTKINTE